jgi:bifunctional DNA-binding transcriptional regulator/antitoxin component of YhaV-PrlF toxin-antitoxin module
MLAKKTSKNQITLPKAVVERFPGVEHFDVTAEKGRIILRPLERSRAGEVRAKLEKLGIDESDVVAAVAWTRKSR